MIRPAILALMLLAACAPRRPLSGAAFEAAVRAPSEFEDQRIYDRHFVEAWGTVSNSVIRARVAVALGRIMKPEGIPALKLLLADEDPTVRAEALFAAGQLGLAPEAMPEAESRVLLQAVTAALKGPNELLRARAIEAMGKLAGDKAPAMAAPLLKDPSAVVRRQAASACFRWRQVLRWRDPAAKPPDMPKDVVQALSDAAGDSDDEVRWRAIHALHRSGSTPETAAVKRFLEDPEPLARVFALNIVERLKLKELTNDALRAASHADTAVRQAALRALDALDQTLSSPAGDPSYHVRVALADLQNADGPVLEVLSQDESPAVRSAALLARVRISGEKSLDALEKAMSDKDPRIRVAAAKGAGHLKAAGLSLLLIACKDESEDVRAAALVVLGEIEGPESWTAIVEGLRASGLAERGSAAEALSKRKESQAVNAAIECFRYSSGRDWVEIRELIVDQLSARPPEGTTPFLLETAKSDPAPSVRQKAAAVLRKRGVKDVPEAPATPLTRTPYFDRRFDSNPTVVMETTKGMIEIECYAAEAPVHVANFAGLVEKGFYDGLSWHRVVPNFVIQGGDPLGNGWGDAGWSLRAEINPIPFKRGTLGMPRSAGFDTGGSQIFITHVPTPHLDGYYTVFGRVSQGFDVLDRIEIGDRILWAKVKR